MKAPVMKRWQAAEFGDPAQVVRLEEVPVPVVGAGEALVRVRAASLALPDLMMLRGEYPMVPAPPVTPGQEVVGVVEKAGDGFPLPVGTRVVGGARFDIGAGGLAEYTVMPGWSAFPVMEGLSDEQAVGFVGSFHVAHIGLHHRARLRAGEVVLVLGGAGRTGSAAIQVAKALGATVVATARTAAKARFCEAQGADLVVDLSAPDAAGAIDALTDGHGVDVVYDTVGGEAYAAATAVLARGARVLLVGFASGTPARPDAQDMLMRDYAVIGTLSSFRDDDEGTDTLEALSAMLSAGQIDPPVTAVHPFDDVPAALARRAEDASGQTVVLLAPTALT
ncbi:MAG: zinc-binding dehydrogenase [Cellulomonas sp.]